MSNEAKLQTYRVAVESAAFDLTTAVADPAYTGRVNAEVRTHLGRVGAYLPPDPPPPPRLLRPASFVHAGTVRLPQMACGQSTAFAGGLLAVRHVAGRNLYLSDSGNNAGRLVYECEADWDRGTTRITTHYGNVFGDWPNRVNGAVWDRDTPGRLWWCGGPPYSPNTPSATVGDTDFYPDGGFAPQPADAWNPGYARHWERGGLLYGPDGTLYSGFGGYYSIVAGGSYGPVLVPRFGDALLGYRLTADGRGGCPRPPDYTAQPHLPTYWLGRDPVDGRGTWTAADEIGGESAAGGGYWHPTRGLCFWASRGVGYINYDTPEKNAVNATGGRRNTLYVYDPVRLGAGAEPDWYGDWPDPPGGWRPNARVAGVCADPSDPNVVYMVQIKAYQSGVEYYSCLHRYRLVP